MRVADMSWKDIERSVKRDPRCCVPIGSVEQHAQLSICTDTILAERIAVEAARPLEIPVFPVIPYGLSSYFTAFPGTINLRMTTLLALMRDVIFSLHRSGFAQICVISGHGGNAPISELLKEIMSEKTDLSLKYHEWWRAPRTAAQAFNIDPSGSHANWFENFVWTRIGQEQSAQEDKALIDRSLMEVSGPAKVREILGDGSYGGPYKKCDSDMQKIWNTGVEETREALQGPWPENIRII